MGARDAQAERCAPMHIKRLSLATCNEAAGMVLVVDVIRAFTTAAYAFAAGAAEILLTGELDEALALRERFPGSLVMGEVGGLKPAGFDLGNSPAAVARLDLRGRRMIQRTSAGTQGVVRSHGSASGPAAGGVEALMACSLVCARATAERVLASRPDEVTFVVTGIHAGGPENDGDEDVACADYVEALLRGDDTDPAPFVRRVLASHAARKFYELDDFPQEDLPYCVDVNRFDFCMSVVREGDLLVMRPVWPDKR